MFMARALYRAAAPESNRPGLQQLPDQAGTGEILISRAAYEAAGQGFGPTEHRELALKGKDGAFEVYVLKP